MSFNQSSIYIRDDLYKKLTQAVDILGVKRSRLIELLFIRYLERNNYKKIDFKSQKYQKIKKETKCRRICIYWRNEIYEQCFDARKVFKKSISYIIAQAIDNYLDEIINEIQNKGVTNNYKFFIGVRTTDPTNFYTSITVWGDNSLEMLKNLLNH